jgi:XisI protein
MDKIELHRNSIQALLQEHNRHSPKNGGDIENELLFDLECDRYQLMRVGWQDFKLVYHTVMHFDIKDGKIWIQQNMYEYLNYHCP